MLALLAVTTLLSGCTRTLTLPDTGDASPETTPVADDTSSDGATDSAPPTGADDTAPDTSPSETADTAPPADTVCLPGEATGFRMPHGRWALATLHASRRYGDLDESALSLSPAWFLASAWERTGFACADYGEPWLTEEPQWSQTEGCLGVPDDTVWIELCRLYPQYFECGAAPEYVAGDHVEAGVMALAWYTLAAHALLQRHKLDPDDWYAAAADPLAVEKLSALMHFSGPWSQDVETILTDCAEQDIGACLTGDPGMHVAGVMEKLTVLETATCYDEPLTEAEVRQYTGELATIWTSEDWEAATEAAVGALTGAGFATDGPAVLDALDETLGARLRCPESELWSWYRLPCP